MLGSAEDAEDVLQEVFVAAHKAILADSRAINARPWLYRIARNRCLNHLRRPVPEGQDSMDVHPHENGTSVADRVQKREEFRALIADVGGLPETQRTALLLREIDALAYEDIAVAMETTVPAVKSLLVRARMSLADCSQGRQLTCDEVHLELAEAAEGLRKASGPVRAHLRACDRCREYRAELRRSGKALAALAPVGPLAALGETIAGKLGFYGGTKVGAGSGASGASAGAAGSGAGAGAVGSGGAAIGTGGAAVGGGVAAGGGLSLAGGAAAAGGIGGALGTKAAAGVASVALLTAGAVEVNNAGRVDPDRAATANRAMVAVAGPASHRPHQVAPLGKQHLAGGASSKAGGAAGPAPAAPAAPVAPTEEPAPPLAEEPAPAEEPAVTGGAESGTGIAGEGGDATPTPTPADRDPVEPTPTEPPPGDPPPVTSPPPGTIPGPTPPPADSSRETAPAAPVS
jgi:RNA polymerase sigma factor (sigma-70 family)